MSPFPEASSIQLHANRTAEGSLGTLSSPLFPEPYPNNADYWVRVVGPPGSRLVFNFTLVDLEPQAQCLYDFVALWDQGAVEPAAVLCGAHTPDTG